MKQFLKVDQLELINGGYLSVKEGGAPITNSEFVAAQKRAEYVVCFAKHAKNKTFTEGKVDSLSKMIREVNAELATQKTNHDNETDPAQKTIYKFRVILLREKLIQANEKFMERKRAGV